MGEKRKKKKNSVMILESCWEETSGQRWSHCEGNSLVKDLKKMNCVGNVTRKFPPSFVMTSYGDFLKDQPERLIEDLKAHQVPFTYRMYGSAKNRLPHVFHCNIKTEDARICNDEECAFFRKFIK